ncbi:MAG: tRNA (adenosine(37)-N6)-threonylcarbamoyltransferase complex dimerization subunit type 1 TsaB [Idiomarina sp.]|nr:tRNA (adenosine(37)-N6)-threonylcarbamoyltransferase complex dimerization subunit type 1 TsaB [Idiomarina sp.]
MRFLAIDSATEFCSVALSVGEGDTRQLYSRGEELPRKHSQALLPFVNEVLAEAEVNLSQLDAIIVSQGPGSFTGVRIGASIAQGLAFSQDLPIVQVSTLAAMAQACARLHQATHVAAAIDARMGEVYFGTYKLVEGLMQEVSGEIVCPPQQVRVAIESLPQSGAATLWHGCGTGWETYPDELQQALQAQQLKAEVPGVVRFPHALDMLTLGIAAFAQGAGIDAVDLSPHYLRNEVTWQKLPGR